MPANKASAPLERVPEMEDKSAKRLGRPPLRDNQHEVILDRAASLFADKGYDAGSIGDLAAALGVSKAAIYHYFPTKQAIFDALILRTLAGLRKASDEAIALHSQPTDQLRAFMRSHARYFEAHHPDFLAMFVAFGNMMAHQQRQEAVRLRSEHEAVLRQILQAGVIDGSFGTIDTGTAARAILSVLNWMARWFHPGGPRTAEDMADDYFSLMVGGIKGPQHEAQQRLPKSRPGAGQKAATKTRAHSR